MEPIRTVAAVVIDENKVLLVKHTKKAGHITGIYGLPAGRIEKGESEVEAARRELLEETGLIAEELEKIPGYWEAEIKRKDGLKRFSMVAFLVKKWKGTLKSSEETEPAWVPLEKLESLPLLPNVEDVVRRAAKNLGKSRGSAD